MATSTQDNLRRLYENGSRYFTMPDFNTFQQDMQDEEKRRRFYNNMQSQYSLPDFDTFSSDIGAVQVQTQTQAPATMQPAAPATVDNTASQATSVQTAAQPAQPAGWKPSPVQQSARNDAWRRNWEETTEEGRRSREQRLQREFDQRLGAMWFNIDPKDAPNAAEQTWAAAEAKFKQQRDANADREWNSYNTLGGGRELHTVTVSMNRHADMVDHLTTFDLDTLMQQAWDNLGEEGQQNLIDYCHQMLKYRNPGTDDLVLYHQAEQLARQQSNLRLYNLAVQKNMPQDKLEYFFRKVGDMNLMLSLEKGMARVDAGKTGDLPAYEDAMGTWDKDNRVLGVTGTVVGFALDPTTWLSAGVGSAAGKGAMWGLGRYAAGKGATTAMTNAAVRQIGTTYGGRIVAGVVGGAANFGTFEAMKEAESQFVHGGHITGRDENGLYVNEGYSAGAIAGQGGHGMLMGASIGWLGPVSGNVSDKLVRATASTAGKVGIRTGTFIGSTMAEGTIFSVPEWLSGKRDAYDVWTDNMAMMIGFKVQHGLKSAPRTIEEFGRTADGRKGMESRIREYLDRPSDGGMALTKDEKAELEGYGYDLNEMVRDAGDPTDAALVEARQEALPSKLTEMVTDPRLSEAVRAKMYYYATGRRLPMSTIMYGELLGSEDGKSFTVQSRGANGVITSRGFKNRKAADLELERINRQAELNSVDIGEKYQQTEDFEKRLQDACRKVADENGWNAVDVYRLCSEARRDYKKGVSKEYDEAMQGVLGKVAEALGEYNEAEVTDAMRQRINEQYGVDIDKALAKEAKHRTGAEQAAIEQYIKELMPEKANEVSDVDAEDLIDQKLLGEDSEPIDPRFEDVADDNGFMMSAEDIDTWQQQQPIGRAVMKYEDRPVEVLNGRVVMMEDGSMVDKEQSDATIVIRDVATGTIEMCSPDDILSYEGYAFTEAMPEDAGAEPSGDGGAEPTRKYGAGIINIRNSDGSTTQGYLTGYVNEHGEYEYVTEGNNLHYASEYDLDNMVAEYIPDQTAEPIVAKDSQGNELAVGDEIVLSAGRRGVVQEIHPDGRVTVNHDGDIITYDEAYGDITATGLRKVSPEAQPTEPPTAPTEPQGGARLPDGMTADRTISVVQRDGSTREYTVAKDQAGKQYVVDESGFMWGHDGNGENMKPYRPGESVSEWTDEQIARLSQPAQPSDAVPEQPEIVPTTAESGENAANIVPEQPEIVPTTAESGENAANIVPDPAETVLTEQPAAEPTPLQRVPKDANGEPKFEATDHETAWDALVEYSEGDAVTAKEIADAMVEEKKKALDKAQKLKLKGKTPAEMLASKKANAAELDKAQKEFEQWQRIAGVEQRRKDAERSAREAEARQRAAERAAQEAAERAAREEAERIEREALNGVPEWHQDTPENARARGFRRFSGQKWERQEPLQGVVGKEVEVKFSSTDIPQGRIAVIEAGQLQPSHIQGERNPLFFIEEAQPKNRTDDISKFAAKTMAEDIRPQEITVSPTAYSGAPTVNTRGEVIQGNNRSDALRYLWENSLPEQQGKYKQFLIDNAEQFGIDPAAVEQMQQPVLVNMLDVDDAEAIRLGQLTAQDTESGGIERIKAKNVAQKLGDNMRTFANKLLRSEDEEASFGQLVDRNGVDVLKWMNQTGAITPTQYQSAFDSKGNLTAEAKNDLSKVLYQAVFKGANQQLEDLFDKLPAKAQRAILSTAFRDLDSPFSQRMLGEIQASIRAYTELMSDANFANAKKLEEVLRAVQAWTQQTALDDRFEKVVPADNYSNFALRLAAMYKANDYSQKTIATTFNEMYDMIQGTVKPGLFNPEPDTTPRTLAKAIREKLGIDYQPAKNDIDNGRNGSTDVALDHQPSEAGQRGSSEPSASGEPAEGGEEPADGGGRAATDSEAATEQPAAVSEAPESLQKTIEAASTEVNTNPTEAQIEAGNYKKGHVRVGDFDITIENPAGSVRSGTDADGTKWETTMANTYGYIKGTEGVDGDHIDVFLAGDMDAWDGRKVFVVDQTNTDGTFDEHKVMLGFNDKDEAFAAYLANYDKDWAQTHQGLRISEANIDDFNKWIQSSHRKTKPFADYTTVAKITDEAPTGHTISGEGYTIAPKPYTNKQGKTLDTYLVTFDRDFSKEEMSALRAKARAVKGWYDRESRGWMLRSAEDAKAFAEEVMSKSDSKGAGSTVSEPEAEYLPERKKIGNFASRYETQDGKTISYTSENPEAYGVSEAGAEYGRGDSGARRSSVQRKNSALLATQHDKLGEGEYSHIERIFRESGAFEFTSGEKVKSSADVAYIFEQLENASVENAFVVLVKRGRPTVIHLSMGGFTSTMVNTPVVKEAAARIKPDKIYFVHNHPSGQLKCSLQDVQSLRNMEKALGMSVEGVIINLKSGKYGTFGTSDPNEIHDKGAAPEQQRRLRLYAFDRHVFAADYDPTTPAEVPMTAEDVAKYISSHRLGNRGKISYLIRAHNGGITANIHSPYTELSYDNLHEIADDIISHITNFGGSSAFIYGDYDYAGGNSNLYRVLNNVVHERSGNSYEVVDAVRVGGNATWSAQDWGLMEPGTEYGSKDGDLLYRDVEDDAVLDEFANGKTVKAYRTMQVIDGGLYSPMATKVGGKETPEIRLGVPEQSEEHPEIIKGSNVGKDGVEYGVVVINKGLGKGTLEVAYNPYIHASRTALNDQFTSAHVRPNLVTVEVEIPESELASGYRAESAKNAVGEMPWHSGSVSGQLADLGRPRRVILSRYDKPIRIVPYKEVAEMIAKQLAGTDIEIPYNVVQPQVAEELRRLGVRISDEASGSVGADEDFGRAEYITDEQIAAINARQTAMADASVEGKRRQVETMSKRLNTPVRIVENAEDIADADEAKQEKMRRAKGWYDKKSGEIVINLSRNRNVGDVAETMLHEIVAHKGLRELVGEDGYSDFLRDVYEHCKADVKKKIADKAAANGWDFEKATDEYLGELSEKGFEDFTEGERSIWQKLNAKVLEAINKLLKGLKLPKWVKLGDNELRYMLWRSHERLRTKGNDYVAEARDIAKREETGLSDDLIFRDPGETDDIWKDGSLGLEERITNASLRLSNNQRGDLALRNDAMRAVCDNLQTLLHDMRNRSGRATSFGGADAKVERGVAQSAKAQRLYDRVTAKRIGDLARVLMQNGYLRDMTSGEMQRIVSALKNATGAEDIASSVEKIMDIMIDNQVRSGSEALKELMSIRGSKVDARGVEVQGLLDADGARMMGAVRRGMKLSEAEIQNKIAEALNRMGDSDQTIADDAALEYAGLQIALDYVQNITGSKNEEKDLRDSLKDAKAEKDAGRMTDDAYDQLVEATEDAIRKNKIERAEAYNALVGRLSDSMRQSIENAKAWREAEKRRIQEIQHNANSDMQGMPSEMHRGKDTWKDGAANLVAATAFAPLATFEQMIRGIAGGKAADGEGYLYNRFVRGLNDARAKEISGYRGKQKKLDEKAREIFKANGGAAGHSRLPHEGRVKSWGDVIRLERKLPKMRVTYFDKSANEMKDAELMQGNLLYIYMVDKMSDGRMKLRKMGITEDDVQAIADFLDPRIKALGDWLQEEFLVETRNEYNETHKRMFGTSMAAIDNYFPLKILGDARGIKEDIDAQDTIDGATSTITGAIKKRKVNTLALDILGADALNVVLDHLAEMEHWNAYAEIGRDMNALLSYGKFRNRVKNMRTIYGAGDALWKRFKDVSRIAFGTYHQEVNDFDEGFLKIARGVTAAKVAFRLNTALKQTLSLPAVIPDMSVSGFIEGLKNPRNPFTWCMENLPVFEERWRSRISGESRLMKSERGWNDWRNNVVELAGRWGMTPNAFIDAVICSIVAKTIYDTKLSHYLKDGYARAEAEARAKQDASIGYNLSQQSSEGAYLAPIQAKKNWLSVMWTVFRNSPMSYTRQVFDSVRNLKRNLTPGKHGEQIEYMTKQTLREWNIDPDNATDQERAKAKVAAKRRYSRSLRRDALRLLTYGFVLPGLWSLGGYWLYMLLGNDEDEKQQMKDDIYARLATAPFEGLTGGDVWSNVASGYLNGTWNENTMTKDMPLSQDLGQIAKKLFKEDKTADGINDIFNLCVQSGFGFNPATIENAVLGILDACAGDVQLANEATIVAARILNCPESQVKKLYFDEIGMSGEEASKLSPAEIAERYARMQIKLGRPIMPWLWDDEAAIDKRMNGRYGTLTIAKERFERQGDPAVKEAYAGYAERYKAVDERVKAAKKLAQTDYVGAAQMMAEVQSDPDFTLYQQFGTLDKQLTKLAGMWIKSGSGAEATVIARAVNDYRAAMVKVLGAPSFAEQQAALQELQGVMQQFSTDYAPYMPGPKLNR